MNTMIDVKLNPFTWWKIIRLSMFCVNRSTSGMRNTFISNTLKVINEDARVQCDFDTTAIQPLFVLTSAFNIVIIGINPGNNSI